VHLILDLLIKETEVLTDDKRFLAFLRSAVELLGLQVCLNPLLIKFPKPGGITLLACLKESSIVLHSYPETRMLYVDIFSCKRFYPGALYQLLDQHFPIVDERRALLLERISGGEDA